MSRSNAFKVKLSSDRLLVLIGLISFFRPTIFEKFSVTNAIFNSILIVDFVFVVILYLARRNKLGSLFFYFSFAFYSCLFVSTLISHGSIFRMLQYVLIGISTVFFVNFVIKYELLFATKVMRIIAWFCVLVNILSVFVFKNGITTTGNSQMAVYFLGQPTRFAYFYLPSLLFCYLGDEIEYGKIKKNTIVLYLICLSTLIASWTVGSTIALLMLIPFYFFGKSKVFNSFLYYGIQLFSFFGLTFYSIQTRYADFITLYLHKDITMSSRTYIWKNALYYYSSSPFWGVGILSNDYMISKLGFVHTHNHLLQVLFQGGYIGLVLFLIMLLSSYTVLNKYKFSFPAKLISFFLFMIGIQLLVDTVDGVRNHYLFIMAMGASYKMIQSNICNREEA